MAWKMDGDSIALDNGNPVWIYDDGKESPLDGAHVTSKITSLTGEAAQRRKELREAQDRMKAFEGIDDAEAARQALATVQNLDAKKLIDAGEAEKVKAEIQKSYELKLAEAQKLLSEKDAVLTREMIGGRFSRSKFISEKLTIPPDLAMAAFGHAFRIEDGNVVAYDHTGNRIFSRERPGEPADFDEALASLVSAYPHRDTITKAPAGSGTGSTGTGGYGGQKTVKLNDFNRMTAKERAAHVKNGGQVA